MQGSDGYFYGTTKNGGPNYYGTVFKISTNGAMSTLHYFNGENEGAFPVAGLVQGSDGNFYGTTFCPVVAGYGYGTVFRISPSGALTTLYSFSGGNDGAYPNRLVQGSDGYFYGTSSGGDYSYNYGTVFKINANGALTTMHSFKDGNDGAYPEAMLVQGRDGYFYGTTAYGGSSIGYTGAGTLFKISTNGALTSLYSFTGGNDGSFPNGLVQGSDGYFYGTTSDKGGTNSAGTVFKMSTNGTMATLYSFTDSANDGGYPEAMLVQGSDGYFYGTTAYGGSSFGYGGAGTVFEISTNGALTTLYEFGEVTNANGVELDGANPFAALVQGSDGNFYGMTAYGGTNADGTVFKMVPRRFQWNCNRNAVLFVAARRSEGSRGLESTVVRAPKETSHRDA